MDVLKGFFSTKPNAQTAGLISEVNSRIAYWTSLTNMTDTDLMEAIRNQTITSEKIASEYARIDKPLFSRLMGKKMALYEKYHPQIFGIYTPLQRRISTLQSQLLEPLLMQGKMTNLGIQAIRQEEALKDSRARAAALQSRLNAARGYSLPPLPRLGGGRKRRVRKTKKSKKHVRRTRRR